MISVRASHTVSYSIKTNNLLLFGGTQALSYEETWIFYEYEWELVQPNTTTPEGMFASAMAYDSIREKFILFGGANLFTGAHNETWSWDGYDWSLMEFTTTSPSIRTEHCMVYDESRN